MAVYVGVAVFLAVLLLGALALLCVTAPARWRRRRHVDRLLASAAAQRDYGRHPDGTPIWPCGPQAVNAQETGYCERPPVHDGEHAGLISSPNGTRRGTWPHYDPQPWKEPHA